MQEIKDWITDLENLQEDVRDIATDMRSMKTGMNKYLLKSGERKQTSDSDKKIANIRVIISATATQHGYLDVWKAVRKSASKLPISALDQKYWAVPTPVWKMILKETKINEYEYQSERADCDDFSKALAGICALRYGVNGIGVVVDISAGHAYNAILCNDDGKLHVKWVEPQTDEIVDLADTKDSMYIGKRGRIHF